MQITFDTTTLSAQDKSVLAFIAGGAVAAPADKTPLAEKAAAPKANPAKPKAAAPVEETPAESDDGPTLEDAVSKATALVSSGNAAKVKAALAEVGAKRVSELDEGSIAAFLSALDA